MTNEDILRVENLSVWILNEKKKIQILHDLTFSVREGERWALAGESGAGKTMTISALTALMPEGSTEVKGKILYRQEDGSFVDLLTIPYKKRQAFISKQIAIIFQDSINALNPNERIRTQWLDTVYLHHPEMKEEEAVNHLLERMEIFQVRGGRETLNKYPHQLSGGMRQRIAIAMALESPARILIADEPTTSLDAITQRNTVDFIGKLCQSTGRTLLYISHNLGILQYLCDYMLVLRNGYIVEQGPAEELFFHAKEEYTRTLVRETMKIMGNKDLKPEIFGQGQESSGIEISDREEKQKPAREGQLSPAGEGESSPAGNDKGTAAGGEKKTKEKKNSKEKANPKEKVNPKEKGNRKGGRENAKSGN